MQLLRGATGSTQRTGAGSTERRTPQLSAGKSIWQQANELTLFQKVKTATQGATILSVEELTEESKGERHHGMVSSSV